jgi:mannose/cellobiose epimerase-like protein (N-acyl-D-glucosamine 2-epimerase family)
MVTVSQPLADELTAIKSWLIEQALPFWSSTGFDRATLLFEERMDFSGRPLRAAPRRLMAQCRQIYVFSHATLLGWFDGRALVEAALPTLLRAYGGRSADAPYVFSLMRDGAVADPRQDVYAYAFLLFALAWARKLLGSQVDQGSVDDLIAHLKGRLAHRGGEGFIDGLPRPDAFLRQNPQMHLFEACLAVEEAFASGEARALSDDLYRLFHTRLFDFGRGALPERHDEHWRAIAAPDAIFEPGHHFEWIWLLDRYAGVSGARVDGLVAALAARAYAEGVDRDGAVIEAVALDGTRRIESRRCWGVCEGLKAAASDFEHGRSPELATQRATRFLGALRRLFLSAPFPGGWVDRIDAAGKPLVAFAPSTTLYHIFLAAAEAHRVFDRPAPGAGADLAI